MNYKAGNALLFRSKSCWFILDTYPLLIYELELSEFQLSILDYNYWLNFKLSANTSDYIRGEAAVLGYIILHFL